ncbi:MAG: DUF3368 domain-containing protein [Bacteroidota bacterium]
MIIISDTSPLTGLLIIGRLSILKEVYEKVIIPQAVLEELLVLETFGYDLSEVHESSWIKISTPSNLALIKELEEELDAGESAAIALAIETNADHLVIDEKKGRRIADQYGIKVIGLTGVLIEAKHLGIIDAVKPILDKLRQEANFRISDSFYRTIISRLQEDDLGQ